MPETTDAHLCARCGGPCDWRGVCPRCLIHAALGAPASTDGWAPGMRLGPYTLLAGLGSGGIGRVWRARKDGVEREVAIKTLWDGIAADKSAREHIQREALATARLRHPGIIGVLEVGDADAELFLVMELVLGDTLAQRLKAGPLPVRMAAELLRAVANAVRHAHAAGVIHRDVKPSNIIMDSERDGAPRLTDFGIARLPGESAATQAPTLEGSGTLAYLAPEQASGRGREHGPATDVYGLGAVLYHCLTGRPPFLATTPAGMLRQIVEFDPPWLRALNPSVPRDLEAIALHCLEKRPDRRYLTAMDLVDELDRVLQGQPVEAKPRPGMWPW